MALHPIRRLNQVAFQRRSLLVNAAYFLHFLYRIIRFLRQLDHIARHIFISLSERHMHPDAGHDTPKQRFRNQILECPVYFLVRDFNDDIRVPSVF